MARFSLGRGPELRPRVLHDLSGRLWVRLGVASLRFSGGRAPPVSRSDEDASDWSFLWRTGVIGFIAVLSIALGVSLPSSPFKLGMPGTWYFGLPNPENPGPPKYLFVGIVAVNGGVALFLRVWLGLMRALDRRRGVPIRYLGWMLVAWVVPLLVVAPLFSRDVFSYAAQGEMMSRGVDPYRYGPYSLGPGPYVNPVDVMWGNIPAAYGPLFLMIDECFARVTCHNALSTIVLLRLLAVAGIGLIAYCMPKLARAYGRDPGSVFTLAVLNPLVLLSLIGSAHNDAIMVGLLVAGVTAAKYKHPAWGVVLCALATAIKAPAALGVVYVAWTWTGADLDWRQRVRPLLIAGIISLGIMEYLALASGLGWGWIANLGTPGRVHSWFAPATAIGLLVSDLGHKVGIGLSPAGIILVTRAIGLVAAAGVLIWLLARSDRIGHLKALGISLLEFVWLGPVVHAWYLTWGLVLLAPVAENGLRHGVVVISVLLSFIGLTMDQTVNKLFHSHPVAFCAVLGVVLLILVAPLKRWASDRTAESPQILPFLPPLARPSARTLPDTEIVPLPRNNYRKAA